MHSSVWGERSASQPPAHSWVPCELKALHSGLVLVIFK